MPKLTWLGQASFRVEAGLDLLLDPYLSDSVFAAEGLARLVPPPFLPEELAPELVLLSHHHLEHTDPQTLERLGGTPYFAGPQSPCRLLEEIGISKKRMKPLSPGEVWQFKRLTVEAVSAKHSEDSLGFVLNIAGMRLYFTGDTLYHPALAEGRGELDLLMVCINGKLGNMTVEDAALLTAELKPKTVMPMHWGMFAENTADPQEFAELVAKKVPDVVVEIPELGAVVPI